ncbi:thiamine diphosphokinase [Aureimonas frigidaquae]|uniref:Thiamine diphosphokinase n=1 Tax=Aureimonas frigidaquae TaxID=424757 RepID=A0A0N7KXU4_9HYPH|nr:thiamine diphosphokinase [Aureimonas frigidaquae]BAT27889.1 putative thiamin pyrophosphokinase [Aureimonas frigidaquae]
MNTACVVLLAGPIEPTPRLRAEVAGRHVIAADGGLRHALSLSLAPDLIVGDLDSAPPDLLARFPGVERRTLPRDKAETDGAAALTAATERGCRDLLILGALGGPRTDHVFSNLVLALDRAHGFDRLVMFDGRERAFPLTPGQTLHHEASPGTQFSICRFGEVTGLTIRGAKWPLDAVTLPFGSVLTQSNEAAGPVAITIATGRAFALFNEN